MRTASSLAVVLLLLAGCSGGDDSAVVPDDAPSTSATSSNTTSPSPPPPPTTDTLHLGSAPEVLVTPPVGTEDDQSAVTYRGMMDPNEGAIWSYTTKASAKLGSLEGTLWLKVVDTLLVQPAQTPCVWGVTVSVDATVRYQVCVNPGGQTIAPGTYEVALSGSPMGSGDPKEGAQVKIQVRRQAFSPSPNDSVFVLTGTQEHDSALTFQGLAEPLPTTGP